MSTHSQARYRLEIVSADLIFCTRSVVGFPDLVGGMGEGCCFSADLISGFEEAQQFGPPSDQPPDLTDRDVVASVLDDGDEGTQQPIVVRSADVDVVDDRLKTVVEVLVNHVEIVLRPGDIRAGDDPDGSVSAVVDSLRTD